jgi:ABC-type transport system involved in multi-copper enzyme maturation permease subunit
MPIHDQSYRRYLGERLPQGRAWTVIAAAGIKTMIGKRKFLGLLVLAWLPFVVRAVQFYVAANFPQASMIAPTAETFRAFVEQQGVFGFFVTIFTGAGLIANDLRANALQIYLSKPMGRAEYIAGKFAVLAFFLLLVTFLPAMLLLAVQIVLAGSLTFMTQHVFLIPAITVYTLVETLVYSLIMLALSSVTKSSRFVGIMFAGMYFFTLAIFQAIRGVTRTTSFSWISPTASLEQLGDIIFRQPPRYETPVVVTVFALVVIAALAGFVLERRVRGVEVVT